MLSWFPLKPDGPMAAIARFFYALTEPVLAPLRAALPPMQMGGMGLDLSPMIVFFVILIILNDCSGDRGAARLRRGVPSGARVLRASSPAPLRRGYHPMSWMAHPSS